MAKGKEWKITFRTQYGLYKWLIIPFGLTNAPVIIQKYINFILLPYLNQNYNAYLDNILIWSYNNNHNIYIAIVKKYFIYLQEVNFFINIKKCEFLVTRTLFLGYILTPDGLEMDPEKVRVIFKWPPLKQLKNL